MRRIHRRDFIAAAGAAGLCVWSFPRASAFSRSPNEKLDIACIGVGGRGGSNTKSVSSENIVAICDVDRRRLEAAAKKYKKAKQHVDFRKLYDTGKFDAVVVSTTEHTHAFATLPALQLGKHVYCEKPLTHSIWEARVITEAAAKAKVATQMGTQIHAGDNYRRVVELIQSDAIGPVHEAHVWVSRAWGGGDRPKGNHPVPDYLDWNLWIGPAPMRPYHRDYIPGPKWYKYWDFGNGTMSDLGSHWNDLPFWALKLHAPLSAEAEGPPPNPETAPATMKITYEYPEREKMPPVRLTWYQGKVQPKACEDRSIPKWKNGVLFIGKKGMLLADYGKHLLLPEKKFKGFTPPKPWIPKSRGHHQEWIHAAKTGEPTTCHFGYSGPLTEANHLGNVAYRAGKKVEWDAKNLKAKNAPEAEPLIRRNYREGWSLENQKGQ
jgi:predicted dehydrogenase